MVYDERDRTTGSADDRANTTTQKLHRGTGAASASAYGLVREILQTQRGAAHCTSCYVCVRETADTLRAES